MALDSHTWGDGVKRVRSKNSSKQGKFATAANPLGFHVLAWTVPLEDTPQPLPAKARTPKLAEPEPKLDKASPSAKVTISRNTGPSRAAVPMFLLAQVLINVRSCRTKVCPKEIQEDVACNKILKPFCVQFRKDEAKAEARRKPEVRSPNRPIHL